VDPEVTTDMVELKAKNEKNALFIKSFTEPNHQKPCTQAI